MMKVAMNQVSILCGLYKKTLLIAQLNLKTTQDGLSFKHLKATKVSKVHRVMLVLKETPELRGHRAVKVLKETQVHKELMVAQVRKATKVIKEILVLRVSKVIRVIKV